MKNNKFYTIFLGDELWENVIDDMNTDEIWTEGGMLWESRRKAEACIRNLKEYDFETEKAKFSVRELHSLNQNTK